MLKYCLITLLLLTSCARNPAYNHQDFVVLSQDQEYEIGRKARMSISNSKVYKNHDKQEYFKGLTKDIYNIAERPNQDLTFYFMNDDSPNAFATPGYIFLNRGLLPYLHDEAQLIAVLGHEIGHITARHMVREKSNLFLLSWFLNSFKIPNGATRANAVDLSQKGFSRKFEYEADELSVRYLQELKIPAENSILTHKGFALQEEIDLKRLNLNKYKKRTYKPVLEYRSTHPIPEKRINKITEKSDKWEELLSPYRQKEFYHQINGVSYGYDGRNSKVNSLTEAVELTSPRSGVYGFKNIAYFKKYGFKMTMPQKYQARVMSGDPVGKNYEDNITVDVFQISDDKNIYSLEIIADLLKLTKRQKKALKKSFNRKDFFGNESSDEQILAYKKSPSLLKMLMGQNSIYYYIYIKQLDKPELADYFNHFRVIVLSTNIKKSFDESMQNDILFIKDNLVELTKKQASNIKPLTIKVKQAKAGDTVEKLSSKNIPYIHFNQEWFRIFNGLFNESEIKPGSWLKLIPNSNVGI